MRIHRREHNRLRAVRAVISADRNRRNSLRLPRAPVVARNLAPPRSVDNVRVERVRLNVAVLGCAYRMPFAKRYLTIIAPAVRAYRSTFLLCPAYPVGKRIRRTHMVELRRRLVVPGTPVF